MHCLVTALALVAIACGSPKILPTRPEVQSVFPHGGQRGTDVVSLIRGKDLQGASDILSTTPKLSAAILSVEHNAIFRFTAKADQNLDLRRPGVTQRFQLDPLIDLLDSAGTLVDYSAGTYFVRIYGSGESGVVLKIRRS
jgi:hypothetical protein